jgi:inorganic pyrophosphatase
VRIQSIAIGDNPPEDINVLVEVPLGGQPIKYELDKAAGTLVVDRFLYTPMTYPGNYGFVPHTLSEDGDPIDVLICNTRPLAPACVINARPIGVLVMEDNAGQDEKILAVPSHKLTQRYDNVNSYSDLPPITLQQIEHFFEHYKDLEPGKWVKLDNWRGPDDARAMITAAIERNLKINGALPTRRDSDPNTDGL